MTTLNLRKFFCFGIENVKGETFHGTKEAKLAMNVATSIMEFYHNAGFEKVVATNCNDNIFVKDSTGRLLAFVTEVCHLEANGSKEYRTAYWAWNEVKRQAQIVAEKAAAKKASAKVDAEAKEGREVATEKNATIKGSIEVRSPQKKTTYYAIRKGRTIGILTDWGEASESVTGYSGAVFKKFSVLKDAEEYMKGGDDE
jgi:viroplasmin and RNaseH domain-containing protein|nr:MAG TPA: viroplasmin [Bacteriophage sp.]